MLFPFTEDDGSSRFFFFQASGLTSFNKSLLSNTIASDNCYTIAILILRKVSKKKLQTSDTPMYLLFSQILANQDNGFNVKADVLLTGNCEKLAI